SIHDMSYCDRYLFRANKGVSKEMGLYAVRLIALRAVRSLASLGAATHSAFGEQGFTLHLTRAVALDP
ncbi:MAG: hypothetical protein RR431_10740, partial [Clostridia bacterium]